jgi:hypothetical protein
MTLRPPGASWPSNRAALTEIFTLLPSTARPVIDASGLSTLNLYAVDVRYSDDWREPQRGDAIRAMEIVTALRSTARELLPPDALVFGS